MDISLKYLPDDATEWDVDRAVASILHSDEFWSSKEERPINFQVKLNPGKLGGLRNDGTGRLTIPDSSVASKFLAYVRENPLKIGKRKIKFYAKDRDPPEHVVLRLQRTLYVSPDIEEARQVKLNELGERFRLETVQIGRFYRPKYPFDVRQPRSFSTEWQGHYVGWMTFEYDHKLIRIQLGDPLSEEIGATIAIQFTNILKIGAGYDGKPYICFDTLTPPFMEEVSLNDKDSYRTRCTSLHPGHGVVAPFAFSLRVILFNDKNDVIEIFIKMCKSAGLPDNAIISCPWSQPIDAHRAGLFSAQRLRRLDQELKSLPWPIAFQLASLLHNGLLHTVEILELLPLVHKLRNEPFGQDYVGDLIREFNEELDIRNCTESPIECFLRIRDEFQEPSRRSDTFRCYHVTVTPTRLLLEGPYATQSNRVIRRYYAFHDYFLRVDFAEEDRLRYRWDKNVDVVTFVQERVGGILKHGFDVAGRHFEFLAYSNSALKQHSVWFVRPFQYRPNQEAEVITVNAHSIRRELGEFTGPLLRCPSKYAARLGQAFTATDSSVRLRRAEWIELEDIQYPKKPAKDEKVCLFTDGVGTISKGLGDEIWRALCAERRDSGEKAVQPSAYQIRFLGYKGVVAVDLELDKDPSGFRMRLRKSMNKFDVSEEDQALAPIEIAQAFDRPMACYLNKPLVMLLEDLGVRKQAFLTLQDLAVADARTIDNSISQFYRILEVHNLAQSFKLSSLLKKFESMQLELNPKNNARNMDTPFLREVRQVATYEVLRDIKYYARIPIPRSYLLVGVADEGPAYVERGYDNVYCLQPGTIYACVQNPGDASPVWIEGSCSISRSPVVHPGDVQRVRAIGKPPEGMLCLFAHLKNVVVLPSLGTRSLASYLGGGDLDGDLYSVITHSPLLPTTREKPASYDSAGTWKLDRDGTVDDICDFIVEYINSDVLGLLSTRLLVIADQSKDGMRDKSCEKLAKLCSQAVDYPKQGLAVDLEKNPLPKTLIRCKPHWRRAEAISPLDTDYYTSTRALGCLYSEIELDEPPTKPANEQKIEDSSSPITEEIKGRVQLHLEGEASSLGESPFIEKVFRKYVREVAYICATHTLSRVPGSRLREAEVVVGTILAKCPQRDWRKDRKYRMRTHCDAVVREIEQEFIEQVAGASREDLLAGVRQSWEAWLFSQRHGNEFGANSFGLIALNIVCACLDELSTTR